MSEGLSHGAFVVFVAAFIVEGAAAAEGTYFAAGEQVMLMLQHDDALLGFHILLFHCSLWINCFFFVYGLFGLLGLSFESFESVEFDLFSNR